MEKFKINKRLIDTGIPVATYEGTPVYAWSKLPKDKIYFVMRGNNKIPEFKEY